MISHVANGPLEARQGNIEDKITLGFIFDYGYKL